MLALDDDQVTFRYKDYADDARSKTMTLTCAEFLRRFLTHVLPRGFVKIRHYGFLANRRREERLTLCRRLLLPLTALALVAAAGGSGAAPANAVTIDPAQTPHCPRCGSCRIRRFELPAERGVAAGGGAVAGSDTS